MAAMMLEAAAGDIEFKDGSFHIVGTDRALPLHRGGPVAASGRCSCRRSSRSGSKRRGTFAAEPSNYPNGCHICEVEIDPETGVVTLARYASVGDVGKIINSLLCEGQIHGGVAQGVGQALMESSSSTRDGQLVTGSFQDYAMPRADDFPEIVSELTRGAGDDQSARHQGRGRGRRDRCAAGRDRRHPRRAASRSASTTSTCRRRRTASGRRSTSAGATKSRRGIKKAPLPEPGRGDLILRDAG